MKKNLWFPKDTEFLTTCASNNEQLLASADYTSSVSCQIPIKGHFIWLGGKEMPRFAHLCIERFVQLHPTWSVKVWKDSDIESLGDFKNRSILLSCINMGMRSDILRYEILRQHGGVYIDIDYEFVRPIDQLCRQSKFFCGFSNVPAIELNNAIIGACPDHPVLTLIADKIHANMNQRRQSSQLLALLSSPHISSFLAPGFLDNVSLSSQADGYSSSEVIRLTGPGLLTTVIAQVLEKGPPEDFGMLLLPAHWLSPVPNTARVDLNALPALPYRDLGDVDIALLASDCCTAECLEQANYFASDGAGSKNGSVDWTDYADLKDKFVFEPEPPFRMVMAVHWWQRSWQ